MFCCFSVVFLQKANNPPACGGTFSQNFWLKAGKVKAVKEK
jgi:hypothetical protein